MDRGTRREVNLAWSYYGDNRIKKILLSAPCLEKRTIAFFANYFHLPPSAFKASVRGQRQQVWSLLFIILNAISNRGSKKDFGDYALLLDHFSHGKMLEFFSCKYAAFNLWHVEKSVVYVDDTELDPDPVDLIGPTWDDVKKKVRAQCRKR